MPAHHQQQARPAAPARAAAGRMPNSLAHARRTARRRRRPASGGGRLEVHAHEEQAGGVGSGHVAELLRIEDVAAGLEQRRGHGMDDALGVAAREGQDELAGAGHGRARPVAGRRLRGGSDVLDRLHCMKQAATAHVPPPIGPSAAGTSRACSAAPGSATARHSPRSTSAPARICSPWSCVSTGTGRQAEDVLQEVYVNVWRAAKTFDAAQSQPLTWLTSIARNRAIDSLRRSQTRPQIQSSRFPTTPRPRTNPCTTPWPTTHRARSIC